MSYEFELHEVRKEVLRMVTLTAQTTDSEHQLRGAKFDIQRYIRDAVDPKEKSVDRVAKEFGTSYEKAIDIVTGNASMKIEDMPPILDDHDGEIKPDEIDGKSVEVIKTG